MDYTPCRWEVDTTACVAKIILKRQAGLHRESNSDFHRKCTELLRTAALPLRANGRSLEVLEVSGDCIVLSFPYPKDMAHLFSTLRTKSRSEELGRFGVFRNRWRCGFCEYIERSFFLKLDCT